jgi:hypothetical protein
MRWVAALVAFAVLPGIAYSQTSTVATEEEDVVRRVITSGGYDGFADKALSRMGDAVAVQVARIVAGRDVTDQEIDGVLLVIHLAFSDSKLVLEPSDRTPRATLFVLRYLNLLARDPAVRARVEETRMFVNRTASTEKN